MTSCKWRVSVPGARSRRSTRGVASARGSCASLPTRRAIIAGQGGVAVAELRVAARPTADPADPGDDAVSASEREVVVAALNRLDAVDRLVIALRHFEQLSEQEMADVLDVPPGTVKSRLSRAMAKPANRAGRGGVRQWLTSASTTTAWRSCWPASVSTSSSTGSPQWRRHRRRPGRGGGRCSSPPLTLAVIAGAGGRHRTGPTCREWMARHGRIEVDVDRRTDSTGLPSLTDAARPIELSTADGILGQPMPAVDTSSLGAPSTGGRSQGGVLVGWPDGETSLGVVEGRRWANDVTELPGSATAVSPSGRPPPADAAPAPAPTRWWLDRRRATFASTARAARRRHRHRRASAEPHPLPTTISPIHVLDPLIRMASTAPCSHWFSVDRCLAARRGCRGDQSRPAGVRRRSMPCCADADAALCSHDGSRRCARSASSTAAGSPCTPAACTPRRDTLGGLVLPGQHDGQVDGSGSDGRGLRRFDGRPRRCLWWP